MSSCWLNILCSQNGWTPLHFAAQNGHILVVEALITAGADVRVISEVNCSFSKFYCIVSSLTIAAS